MTNTFIVNCGCYPFDIMVHFGEDRTNLYKKLKNKIPQESIDSMKELKYSNGKSLMHDTGQMVLWLKEKPNTIKGLATLNHEIFHCVCFLMERIGVVYSNDSDEAFAYLIEYVSVQIYSKLGIKFNKNTQK